MIVVLIIIGIIIYFSIGTCIAAIKETDLYNRTGKYGLNVLYIIFWPFYIAFVKIKELYTYIKNRWKINQKGT